MSHRMGVRQRWAWWACGALAAMGVCAAGFGWPWVLAGGLAAGAAQWVLDEGLRECGLAVVYRSLGLAGKLLAAGSFLWYLAAGAWAATLADRAFPMTDAGPLTGLTLLALAGWGSVKGEAACARCAGVLLLFLLPVAAASAVFAVPMIEPQYLRPAGDWRQSFDAAVIFLLPSGLWALPCRRRKHGGGWRYLLIPVVAAAMAAVTAGVLSPALAARLDAPFYTVVQSVNLFGVMERVEPLLSAAMTVGAFCLVSACACACRAYSGSPYGGAAACAAGAGLLPFVRTLPAIGTAAFGLILPVLVVLMTRRRKNRPFVVLFEQKRKISKKSEKRC